MKKHILFFVVVSFALIAYGCSKDTPKKDLKEFSHESYGDVKLCEYKGIEADKPIYPVTEEDVDMQIESLLYDYVETTSVTRGAKEDDSVAITLTISCDGEVLYDYTEEEYYTNIGYEEFGPEFDQKLIGLKAGDNSKFSITYAEDYYDTEFAGRTIDYDVTVKDVYLETYPELTDEFIKDTLGYESQDAMIDEITKDLEDEYKTESINSAKENIISTIIENSTFNDYSKDLYNDCKASVEASYDEYVEMFGCSSREELYEMFEMTEEDVENEILNQVYRIIVIDAISEKEDFALTNKEYENGLVKLVKDYGYETIDDLLSEQNEATLYQWILEEKVLDFLYTNAKITEVEYNEEDFE
ncbi:MAG: hypothetical protein E7270_02165 [Lachnospiraceae bacterium]|nr:hypothetical protein [Lachnospiraceae bacterium]